MLRQTIINWKMRNKNVFNCHKPICFCGNVSEKEMEVVKNIVEIIQEEDIYNILNNAIKFSAKFEILFYTKKETKISGYLAIRNKTFYFEIRLYKFPKDKEFTMGITVGKINIVKKVTKVI